MATVLQVCGVGSSSISNTTPTFVQCANAARSVRTVAEAEAQITYNTAGTLSNLWINVSANTRNGAVTIVSRKNGGNGNQSISVSASGTGAFEDTSNIDAITAGDEVNVSLTAAGTTGTFTYRSITTLFNAAVNTVIHHATTNKIVTFASATRFQPLAGNRTSTVTESNHTFDFNSAGTLQKLFLYVSANARTTATTFGSRVNGINGALSISVAGAGTGVFEDTANSDTIAANDDVNYYITSGAGTETLTYLILGVEFLTTNKKFHSISATSSNMSAALTRYFYLGGEVTAGMATETQAQSELNITAIASNLIVNVSANGVSAASTFSLRDDENNSALTISITASTTGAFEDASNTANLLPTDLVNYGIVIGATGTSITLETVGVMFQTITPAKRNYGYMIA